MSFNSTYKIPKDASYVTFRNQNRMLYANYRIQQNNVQQGCQGVMRLENGGVADADIIPKLLEGARETTAAEITVDLASQACPVTTVPIVIVDPYLTDKIYLSLTTNQAAYKAAAIGSWVAVTSAEYTTLQTNVLNTAVAGLVTSILSTLNAGAFTFQNFFAAFSTLTNTPAIPANTYVYAFAINIKSPVTTTLNAFNVYSNSNTASTSGFTKIGPTLPNLVGGINYFVYKGQSSINGATDGLLGITVPGDGTANAQSYHLTYAGGLSQTSFRYTNSVALPITSSTSLTNSAGAGLAVGIQSLTATSIQWVTS